MSNRPTEAEEQYCRHCKAWSPVADWREVEDGIYCEDCGSHGAFVCPLCEAYSDAWVWPPATRPLKLRYWPTKGDR